MKKVPAIFTATPMVTMRFAASEKPLAEGFEQIALLKKHPLGLIYVVLHKNRGHHAANSLQNFATPRYTTLNPKPSMLTNSRTRFVTTEPGAPTFMGP